MFLVCIHTFFSFAGLYLDASRRDTLETRGGMLRVTIGLDFEVYVTDLNTTRTCIHWRIQGAPPARVPQ